MKTRSLTSQRVNQMPSSGIKKFFDLLDSMEDIISLALGEPDFATPWNICEAAIRSMKKGQTKYTSCTGIPELRQELSRHLRQIHNIDYDPDNELLITVGTSEALDLTMRAILDPGDEVILPDPCYPLYRPCIALSGGIPVIVPTNQEGGFEVNAADIESRITSKTKALLLNYPSNPTGAEMSRDKLAEVAEVALRHQLLVISDEIYAQIVYGVKHTCPATLPGMKENTILLSGFSKANAMTGWRIGYAAGDKEIISSMTKIHLTAMLCAPILSQVAAIEALRSGETSIAQMVKEYNQRRQVIVNGLNEIGLSCFEPQGAFYVFPSIKSTGMTSEDFAEKLLLEEKVAVIPGTAFGQHGEGHVRCCYAISSTEIEEALSRMKRFVERHHMA